MDVLAVEVVHVDLGEVGVEVPGQRLIGQVLQRPATRLEHGDAPRAIPSPRVEGRGAHFAAVTLPIPSAGQPGLVASGAAQGITKEQVGALVSEEGMYGSGQDSG